MKMTPVLVSLAAVALLGVVNAGPAPLKVLLITGGCCHDYKRQKDILKQGLEARANVVVDQIHVDDSSTKPALPIYGNADYAAGYDVVIHDECAADINKPELIEAVLAPHRKGMPAVNLHCAMHCYRSADFKQKFSVSGPTTQWFEFLGLQSTGHGPQKPIAIKFTAKDHAITRGLDDWTTINEELYNNIHVFPTATALATGTQEANQTVVAWTNDFKGTRVFCTTIGHNNATVEDPRYLDLVTRGLLWATGKLDAQGNIAAGYAKEKPKQ